MAIAGEEAANEIDTMGEYHIIDHISGFSTDLAEEKFMSFPAATGLVRPFSFAAARVPGSC
jgi:hypothetical protein